MGQWKDIWKILFPEPDTPNTPVSRVSASVIDSKLIDGRVRKPFAGHDLFIYLPGTVSLSRGLRADIKFQYR